MRRVSFVGAAAAMVATTILAVGAAAEVDPGSQRHSPAVPESPAIVVRVATGPDPLAAGYLEIGLDEYGSFGSVGIAGNLNEDLFNPGRSGLGLEQAAFTAGYLLFVPSRSQREILTDMTDWLSFVPDDLSLSHTILTPNLALDLNSDGVFDTLSSSFEVTGSDTSLRFDVVQSVSALGGGVAILTQDHTVTNTGSLSTTFSLVRVYDGDLPWSLDFTDDEVGTTQFAEGTGPFVAMQEVSAPGSTAVTLSGAGAYFGGKNGIEPPLGPPAYGFGTDLQIWDAFGLPASWTNHIAGIGYDSDGFSGAAPPGADPEPDALIGVDFEATLSPGDSTTVTVVHTYGSNRPRSGFDLTVDGVCPGPAFISVTGGTADGGMAILSSTAPGSDPVPAGPCAGVVTGLSAPSPLALVGLDPNGGFFLSPTLPGGACGLLLQMLDATTCALSPVTALP